MGRKINYMIVLKRFCCCYCLVLFVGFDFLDPITVLKQVYFPIDTVTGNWEANLFVPDKETENIMIALETIKMSKQHLNHRR